ncbi:hypothetical protein CLV40_123108, partial [Actinokineospora auranticolor]
REKLLLDPAKTVSFQRTQFYLVHCPETSKHLTGMGDFGACCGVVISG